jgi:hypothetical protein
MTELPARRTLGSVFDGDAGEIMSSLTELSTVCSAPGAVPACRRMLRQLLLAACLGGCVATWPYPAAGPACWDRSAADTQRSATACAAGSFGLVQQQHEECQQLALSLCGCYGICNSAQLCYLRASQGFLGGLC